MVIDMQKYFQSIASPILENVMSIIDTGGGPNALDNIGGWLRCKPLG